MALTRKLLKSIGLDDEKIDMIIEAHGETVEALKKERDDAAAEAGKVEEVTRQLNEANEKLAKSGDADKVRAEFDAYKATVEKEKTNAAKRAAFKALFKDSGVTRDSFCDVLLKEFDLDAAEMDGDKLKNADSYAEKIKSDYADFISETSTQGTPPAQPPKGNGGNKDPFEQGFDE